MIAWVNNSAMTLTDKIKRPVHLQFFAEKNLRLIPTKTIALILDIFRRENSVEGDVKNEAVLRLKKAEGQLRGIQKMFENGRCHGDVGIQLSAAEKAVHRIHLMLLKGHSGGHMSDLILTRKSIKRIDELVDSLFGLVK